MCVFFHPQVHRSLPTLLPTESSEGFATDLAPVLAELPDGDVWQRALKLFRAKASE